MDKGFHQSFEVGDKVSLRHRLIMGQEPFTGMVTGLADSPEVYIVENERLKLIAGNGALVLESQNTNLVEVE